METSDRELQEDLLHKLVDQRLMGPTAQISLNPDPAKLPIRDLPYGTYASLYVMYVAFCKVSNEPPAGRTLFYDAASEWKSCLKFRKKTVHAVCSICSELRAKIEHAGASHRSLERLICFLLLKFSVFTTY